MIWRSEVQFKKAKYEPLLCDAFQSVKLIAIRTR